MKEVSVSKDKREMKNMSVEQKELKHGKCKGTKGTAKDQRKRMT